MSVELAVFYLLAFVAVGSAVMVIASRNPVHSVLFLILCFFNSAGLFILIGAEFLAMVLVVVYVGAVAVLFLFVVMMLDVTFAELRAGFLQYLPVGGLIGVILFSELVLVAGTWAVSDAQVPASTQPIDAPTNTEALGNILYTQYFYLFQAAGLVLLVAIIGAITLTMRQRGDVKRQDITRQVARQPMQTVELRKRRSGEGL